MNACARDRHEQLRERVRFLSRTFARSVMLSSQLESLARQLEPASAPGMNEVAERLRELSDISPKLRAAMEEYDHKASVDRAEGFLGDLASETQGNAG